MQKFAVWFLKGLMKMFDNNPCNITFLEGVIACIVVFSVVFGGLVWGLS